MKKSPFAFLFICLLMLTLFAACDSGESHFRIGVSQCSQDDWRMKVNDEINREMIFHDNAEVEIRSARDNNAKQIADIRYFIDNDFDAIIVSPNEASAITPIIEEAYNKGIPVVIFDRDISSDKYTAKVGVDNESIGREAAIYSRRIADGRLNILEFQGLEGATPAAARHKGFNEEIDRMPDAHIVCSHFADWYELDAEKAADSILPLHPEINLIFAHNDRMAIGAARSARRQGRRDIKVIGVDAAPNLGIKAVADSVIDATFLYPTEGHLLVQTAMNILEDKPYEAKVMIPALPAVDRSNAAIMLHQDKILQSETKKLLMMNNKANAYSSKYSFQTVILVISILLILMLFALVFVMLRSARLQRRNRRMLSEQNRELMQQRDKQRDLYRKLDEAMQSKLVFFTNVSHDLRTPLTLIAEPIRALEKSQRINQQERSMLRIADRNIDILQRLINQILDFRKFESGKLDFHPEEVDPCALLRQWLESFKAVALRRNIKLTLDCHMDPQVLTMAVDAEKIERVMYNLVSNALRHTADGGRIEIGVSSDSRYLRISVRDNGEGIDPDKLPLIFEQFYQAGDHGSGSGIGLSLTKAFVELHDGEISVESTPGQGSCFTVTLPVLHVDPTVSKAEAGAVCPADAEAEKTSPMPVSDGDKPLLLAIDDNEDIRSLLTHLLGDEYNVMCAVNGRDGLEKAIRYVPDLILCDVMMPVMDGLECCRRLKNEVSTSHIPVLMLTARSLDEQRVEGYDSGADAYISKPFGAELLRSRCRNLLLNRKRIRNIFAYEGGATATADDVAMPLATSDGVRTDIDNEFYRRFIAIVGPKLRNPALSVENVAEEIGLSQSQLTRKIKALTGLTPVELIRNLRLAMANRMLRQSDKPVSEIAAACGFTSHAYFSKCYRDAYGRSPSDGRHSE